MLQLHIEPARGGTDWDWAVANGKVTLLNGVRVALLGAADYAMPDQNTLLSINGAYLDGLKQGDEVRKRRDIRWACKRQDDGRWDLHNDELARIALELLGGIITSKEDVELAKYYLVPGRGMVVEVKVCVNVEPVEEDRYEPREVSLAVAEALSHALRHGEQEGFVHALADEVSILVKGLDVLTYGGQPYTVRHSGVIKVPAEEAARLEHWCRFTPGRENCQEKDKPLFDREFTFPDGKRMAVQVVPSTNPDEEPCWTQGVLFDAEGHELGCTGVGESFLGEYCVIDADADYVVDVQAE